MSATYNDWEKLDELSKDLERVRTSINEESDAINWYQQRISATKDPELRHILEHNRDEEKEHLAMLIEWIRKHDTAQDKAFKEHD
ncbi:MAG: ferritin [Deltaproteobacteria bacterium]|nr:ferritin [Deltaproteobacteria bacterium]MCL5791497.1 ferritin [Deltaproteobacteria bacterium]